MPIFSGHNLSAKIPKFNFQKFAIGSDSDTPNGSSFVEISPRYKKTGGEAIIYFKFRRGPKMSEDTPDGGCAKHCRIHRTKRNRGEAHNTYFNSGSLRSNAAITCCFFMHRIDTDKHYIPLKTENMLLIFHIFLIAHKCHHTEKNNMPYCIL